MGGGDVFTFFSKKSQILEVVATLLNFNIAVKQTWLQVYLNSI